MEDLIDINMVINLLELTFRAGKNQDQNSAEAKLNKMAQNTLEMANVLLKIIGTEQVNELVKESASIFLTKVLRSKKFKPAENVLEFIANISALILTALGSQTLSSKIKCNLKESLITVLQEDSSSFFKEKITQIVIRSFSSNNIPDYLTGFMITHALLCVMTKSQEIKKFFLETIAFLNSIAAKLLLLFNDYMKNLVANQLKRSLNKLKDDEGIIFEALLAWAEIMELFTTKFCESKNDTLENLFSNQSLSQLFQEIFIMSFRVENQLPDCIFSTTGILIIDESLHHLKKIVMYIYNMVVVQTLRKSSSNPKLKNSFFFKTLQGLTPRLIGSLIQVVKLGTKIEEHENLKGLIHNSLNLLNNCIKTLELYPIFAQNKEIIIAEFIFPCLTATPQEINLIEENPEEFFHQALDVCDKQNSETLKTLTAKIMESMSDHIDGSLSIISNLAISLLHYSIESNNANEIQSKYQFLLKYNYCDFLTKTSAETRIEGCLIILCILNYAICKRKDLIKRIEILLIQNYNFFTSLQISSLLQSRVSLFFGYYLHDVFVSKEMTNIQKDFFSKYLFYLTEALKLSNQTVSIISLHALDALNYILQNKEHLDFVKILINEIFAIFISLIPTTHLTDLWDLIQELLNDYFLFFTNKEDVLRNLMSSLRDRILNEMSKIKNSKIETNIFINKSWNIIRSASENKYFLPSYVEIMEGQLYPLFELLKDPRQIDFDEDILLLIAEFIKKSQRITSLEKALFKFFGLYFEKYHFVFGNLFATLNYYIFYGRDFFSNDKQCLNLILEIGIQALFVNNQFSNEANQSQGALIIQSILQNQSNFLSEEQKLMIITKTIERGYQNIQKDFLKCQLNEIFLCFFLLDYDFICNFLIKNAQLEPVIKSILDRTNIYQHTYDKKLFVFGMTQLILRNFTSFMVGKLIQILGSLIHILKLDHSKKEKPPASIKRKENQTSEILCEEEENNTPTEESKGSICDNEEDDADYSFTDIDFDEENEMTTILNNFMSPITMEDEYQFFRQAITKIKNENYEILQSLMIDLSIEDKQALNDILLCQKIVMDQIESKVFRKIVKVKNKN